MKRLFSIACVLAVLAVGCPSIAHAAIYGQPTAEDWRESHGSTAPWGFIFNSGSGTRAIDASWLYTGATLSGFDTGGVGSGCATITMDYDHDVVWVPWPDVSQVTTAVVYAYQVSQGTMLAPVDDWSWVPRMTSTEAVMYDGLGNAVNPGPASAPNMSVPNSYGDALIYSVSNAGGWTKWTRVPANHNDSLDSAFLSGRAGQSGSTMYVVMKVYYQAGSWHRDRYLGWTQRNMGGTSIMAGWSRLETSSDISTWTASPTGQSPHFKAPYSMTWRDHNNGSYGYTAMQTVNGIYNMPGFVAGGKFTGASAWAIIGAFDGFDDSHLPPAKTMQDQGYTVDDNGHVTPPESADPAAQAANEASASIPGMGAGLGQLSGWFSGFLSQVFSPVQTIVNTFFWWATALQNWGS